MSAVRASVNQIRFKSVILAFQEAGIPYDENNANACLVWSDTLKDLDYFKGMQPWQVVNRIPNMMLLCKKATFARIIQHIQPYFPELYNFIPKTYILPFEAKKLVRAIHKNVNRYIIKPDNGSLGQGIVIVEPGSEYNPIDMLAVGQMYIESHALDDRKYDLRVYALIASVTPLRIFVYRDGVARFCSESLGDNSIYAQLTNIGLNKENADVEEMAEISKLISDVFPLLGVKTDDLWAKIDKVVVLSILSCYRYLQLGEKKHCSPYLYPRCFQILGFDIMFDKEFNPYCLEVNYRPSLDFYRGPERRMKVSMIRDAIRIACPLSKIQTITEARKFTWEKENWMDFVSQDPDLLASVDRERDFAIRSSKYQQVYPTEGPMQQVYDSVLERASQLPMPFLPNLSV